MPGRTGAFERNTSETQVSVEITLEPGVEIAVDTGVAFLDHLLHAMAFHGRFGLRIAARGDLQIDEHHLVEDTGIVLGEALNALGARHGPLRRYAHALIPMDEALGEVSLDVCGRSCLVFVGEFPQPRVGGFEVVLLKEFLQGLCRRARLTLHAVLRHGENSHHLAEALFKALGVALAQAYAPAAEGGRVMSTKGTLD